MAIALACFALAEASAAKDKDKKEKEHEARSIDSGSFGIFMGGRRVGTEKFSIDQANGGSVIRSEFKTENDPNAAMQNSVLELTATGDIRRYEWKEMSPGKGQSVIVPNNEFLNQKWSAGPGEESLVDAIARKLPDRPGTIGNVSLAGKLDLAQMWKLVAGARILIALDSGIAHLAKHTLTPTVCLFGPGSALLFGAGRFWREAPFRSVTIDNFVCRDQTTLFRRDIGWVRRCQRTPGPVLNSQECPAPACMQAIEAVAVVAAADALLADTKVANAEGGDLR